MSNTFYSGRTALVTGASSGIGKEFCLQLAAMDCTPILVARRVNRLEELAAEIDKKYGIKAIVIPADLTQANASTILHETIMSRDINVDILINNAGFGFQGSFLGTDAGEYSQMATLNMSVLTELSRLFSEAMVRKKFGGILNVASMAGFTPIPYFAVYAATKSYVNSFSCALWYEFKNKGVHVTSLCPGPVETEFFEVARADKNAVPVRQVQQADEVAATGLTALAANKMLAPTTRQLNIMSKMSALAPLKLNMRVAASFMKKKD
ncbi:MAG: SDR family oxidoreductase [Balneolales bacterium]|nr:SDR family oxidoreductase [Balneolales bacterium]